jgi:hypothetical protein
MWFPEAISIIVRSFCVFNIFWTAHSKPSAQVLYRIWSSHFGPSEACSDLEIQNRLKRRICWQRFCGLGEIVENNANMISMSRKNRMMQTFSAERMSLKSKNKERLSFSRRDNLSHWWLSTCPNGPYLLVGFYLICCRYPACLRFPLCLLNISVRLRSPFRTPYMWSFYPSSAVFGSLRKLFRCLSLFRLRLIFDWEREIGIEFAFWNFGT